MAHILLVDDCRPIRSALSRYLRLYGYEVTDVASNRSALEAIGPHIDLVVANLKAPGQYGAVLLDALRDRCALAPVIVMSGRFPHPGETAGAAFVLFRPFEPHRLLDAIRHVLPSAAEGVGGA